MFDFLVNDLAISSLGPEPGQASPGEPTATTITPEVSHWLLERLQMDQWTDAPANLAVEHASWCNTIREAAIFAALRGMTLPEFMASAPPPPVQPRKVPPQKRDYKFFAGALGGPTRSRSGVIPSRKLPKSLSLK